MAESLYTDGRYLKEHPSWHVEDSAWKARQILRILKRNHLEPASVAEVGCGAGEVLRQLQLAMSPSCEFCGYEISPQVFRLCQEKANDRLHFKLQDLTRETNAQFDLLMLIDVVEHVEDYFGFLRSVKPRSRYKVLHIPLDLSVQSVFRASALMKLRRASAHIHYFTRETALQSLADAGYSVVDHFLTAAALDAADKPLRTRLVNVPRWITSLVSQSLSSRLFGGFSLMVLAT
jgi:cyclopropane fatty-acyl-phospholipid synthase-like methyltransferase